MGQVLFFGKEPKPLNPNYFTNNRRQIHVMLCKGMNITKTGIYRLWFDDHFYIGRASNIRKRVTQHQKEIEYMYYRNQPKGWYHQNIINFLNHNPDFSIIKVEILEECRDEFLHEREQHYLTMHKSDKCLNGTLTASRTWKDKAREEFQPGVYAISFQIDTLNQLLEYRKLLKMQNVISFTHIKQPI